MKIEQALLLDRLGISQLNEMQMRMSEVIRHGNNVILLSPTGSGKTLAYMLALVSEIDETQSALQVMVILPSRELAIQSECVLREMKLNIRSLLLYGGRPMAGEIIRLREVRPHVVFATPGRLLDHLGNDSINVQSVNFLIVDEFDKCLELGFEEDMRKIAKKLSEVRQCLLISATDGGEGANFFDLLKSCRNHPIDKLDYRPFSQVGRALAFAHKVPVYGSDRLETLSRLLSFLKGSSVIVFVAYRNSVDEVLAFLRKKGFSAVGYHGGMEQYLRERNLCKFRNQSANILVSTDLAARGLDIPNIKSVVHFHIPLTEDCFIHRSGRTARWTASGDVYILTGSCESIPEFVGEYDVVDINGIEVHPCMPAWTTLYIAHDRRRKFSRGDVVGFLCKVGGLSLDKIGRIDVVEQGVYVAVLRTCLEEIIVKTSGQKMKGVKVKISVLETSTL